MNKENPDRSTAKESVLFDRPPPFSESPTYSPKNTESRLLRYAGSVSAHSSPQASPDQWSGKTFSPS
ncbi:hypothetical protein GT039_09735 [Streptomyces sp. SID2955]|nr:hypothetical protein [Streptomyces sp. SID2955]